MAHMPAEERRRQLVEAATRVIAEVGLEAATTRLIATEASAPLSSLHYTFRDKSELLAAVYQHMLERHRAITDERVVEGCGLEAGARELTLGFFEDMRKNESLMAANYEIFFWSIRTPSSGGLAARVYDGYRRLCVEALLRATGETLTEASAFGLAQFLIHATDGVFIQYLSERDVSTALASLETFTDIAIQRFRPTSGSA